MRFGMTRETKIGLLVGLAFIIVIGILLSDHFRGTLEPPPAVLDRAGATVRQTVNAPGVMDSNQPIVVAPAQVNPRGALQTPQDIEPAPGPVVLNPANQTAPQIGLPASDPLVTAARQQGEEIIPADTSPAGSTAATAQRSYQAQSGDTVSRMAARLLGANTAKNRQAIIAANPSLQDNPNMVIVGRAYIIPGAVAASLSASTAKTTVAAAAGGQWFYKVKEGDTLWGIATGQLGDAGAVDAIKELNRTALHGGTTLRPGMNLRLPSQPVAIAE
jgi:nucleoid-associated protein YgaU